MILPFLLLLFSPQAQNHFIFSNSPCMHSDTKQYAIYSTLNILFHFFYAVHFGKKHQNLHNQFTIPQDAKHLCQLWCCHLKASVELLFGNSSEMFTHNMPYSHTLVRPKNNIPSKINYDICQRSLSHESV